MSAAYFDASAIIKLGVHERESEALVDLLQQPLECSTSSLSRVETVRALRRLAIPRDETTAILRGFFFVDLSNAVLDSAAVLDPAPLRALDAIHLASALSIGNAIQFVTYDNRLATAAQAHGLRVVQPGRR